MKILVVDDVDDNLELMRRWLSRRGHDVITASNGESGIALTKSQKPDIVFMDIGMPHMSGDEAIRRIRLDPDIAGTPVIALTAHAMANERDEYFAAGADDVATKPVDFAVIRELLTRYADGR